MKRWYKTRSQTVCWRKLCNLLIGVEKCQFNVQRLDRVVALHGWALVCVCVCMCARLLLKCQWAGSFHSKTGREMSYEIQISQLVDKYLCVDSSVLIANKPPHTFSISVWSLCLVRQHKSLCWLPFWDLKPSHQLHQPWNSVLIVNLRCVLKRQNQP